VGDLGDHALVNAGDRGQQIGPIVGLPGGEHAGVDLSLVNQQQRALGGAKDAATTQQQKEQGNEQAAAVFFLFLFLFCLGRLLASAHPGTPSLRYDSHAGSS
jgi:hypothetical protein